MKMLGILLIVFGVVALAYGGFSFTHKEKILDIGPIQATADKRETIPLPPVVGGIALVGGIAMLVMGKK
jgi:hypothetical protein